MKSCDIILILSLCLIPALQSSDSWPFPDSFYDNPSEADALWEELSSEEQAAIIDCFPFAIKGHIGPPPEFIWNRLDSDKDYVTITLRVFGIYPDFARFHCLEGSNDLSNWVEIGEEDDEEFELVTQIFLAPASIFMPAQVHFYLEEEMLDRYRFYRVRIK